MYPGVPPMRARSSNCVACFAGTASLSGAISRLYSLAFWKRSAAPAHYLPETHPEALHVARRDAWL